MADQVATLQKQVERKRAEVLALEQSLVTERAYLQGLEAALKTVSRNSAESSPVEKKPRAGSDIARCMETLKLNGKPMHVDALLGALGKEVTKANRLSLAGSLAGYARDEKWFVRGPIPNTFGLIGMNLEGQDQVATQQPVM